MSSIKIPEFLNSIERHSFDGCSNLTNINIPFNAEYIGEHAFDGCPIEKITLPISTNYNPNSFDKMTKIENLKVFISYSWDDEKHKAWVDRLANDLNKKADVILDREELGPGSSKSAFLKEIHDANKVICILTPEYMSKVKAGEGVLGREEYPIIKDEIENRKDISKKYIPILRKGTEKESIPVELSDPIFVDFRKDEEYHEKLDDLLKLFY